MAFKVVAQRNRYLLRESSSRHAAISLLHSHRPLTSIPKTSEGRPLSQSCLALLLGLMFFVGLAGCGPAPSDNASTVGVRASVHGPPLSQQGSSPRADPFTPSANPLSSTPGYETGSATGKGAVTRGESLLAVSASSTKPADTIAPTVVPAWMAKELDSGDGGSRHQTLESWAQSAQPGAIDR